MNFALEPFKIDDMKASKYSYKATMQGLASLSVTNVGWEKTAPNHKWGPGIRDHYLIHYIIAGKGNYRFSDHKTQQLSAGDAFLIYPNTEISYQADADEPWEYVWVGFTGSDAMTVLSATDFCPDVPFLKNISYGDRVQHEIKHLYHACGNQFSHAVEMAGRLYTLLSVFMQGATKVHSTDSASGNVQKAVEYINCNYAYPITVENIAAYVGISRSQLFRSFRDQDMLSPKEYLSDYRIRQACHLLEDTGLSITAIANSVGFDNSLYFSKVFHHAKGMSPTQYRKRHQIHGFGT